MSRRISIIFASIGLVIVVLLAVIVGIAWLSGRDVSAGPIGRSTDKWIATRGSAVPVSMALDAKQLPQCDTTEHNLDVALLIDRSSSMMANNAVRQAADAAIAFAEVLEGGGTSNRVGTIIFNDSAQELTPLGASVGNLRIKAETVTADGGTTISSGLQAAEVMLATDPRSAAAQVVLLLSDGGGQDQDLALLAAQQIKAKGVYLITVLLPGDEQVPGLLRSLANSPGDFHTVDNLPSLSDLYRNLASSVSNMTATNVDVQQPYPADTFDVDPVTIQPANGTVMTGTLAWQLPLLTANGAQFAYSLIPRAIGLLDVAGQEGSITMLDCAGTPAIFVLPLGPKVLVSPLPPLLLALLPLLFFLPLMFLFVFGRKPKPTTGLGGQEPPFVFDFREKPAPLAWLPEVPPLQMAERQAGSITYPDALIIGVGQTGSAVLGELKRLLCEQEGGHLPKQIRILNLQADIGQAPEDASAGTGFDGYNRLETDETLTLTPNLERVVERLRSKDPNWNHLLWWGDHTPDDPGRAGARMALFFDLLTGEGQSRVWQALRKRLDGLRRPLVFVVASLADPDESGMALDLPHFIKQAADELGTGTRRVMAVFALQRAGTRVMSDGDAARHTFASMRELQRILLRERFAFAYNPGIGGRTLVGSTDTTPVDACYLVDGISKKQEKKQDNKQQKKRDFSELPEETALYPTLADALLTLMSSSVVDWHQDYVNGLPTIARRTEAETGLPTVSSLNCAVVQYPLFNLKQVIKARFLLDLMFGGLDGKAPVGIARLEPGTEQPRLEARAGLEGQDPRARALKFLKEGGKPNRHPAMGIVAQVMEGGRVDEDAVARVQPGDVRIDDAFRWALRDELLVLLNGTSGNVITNRTGKLGGSLVFLSALASLLKEAEVEVPRRLVLTRNPELRQDLTTRISRWRQTVENSLPEARRWEQVILSSTAKEPGSATRQRSRRQEADKPEPATLYEILSGDLKRAQQSLKSAAQPPQRTLIDCDEVDQETLYQQYLGPERLKEAGGLRPLESAIARIGWWVGRVGDRDMVQLRLMIVPPAAAGDAAEPLRMTFQPEQVVEIRAMLGSVADRYLPMLDTERFGEHLRAMGVPELTGELLAGENPLIKIDETTIGQLGGTMSSHLVLTLSDSWLSKEVKDAIVSDYAITAPVEVLTSDDPYRCALAGLTDVIPVESIEAIDQASLDYASDALTHVFMAEQTAARLERDWRTRRGYDYRFHPKFARLLDNADLVRLLMTADMYGLLIRQRTGAETIVTLSTIRGEPGVEIKRGTVVTDFEILYTAYETWLNGTGDLPMSRTKWRDTQAALEKAIATERQQTSDRYEYAEAKRNEADERLMQDQEHARKGEPTRKPWERDVDAYKWLLAEQEKRSALD